MPSASASEGEGSEYSVQSVDSMCVHAPSRTLVVSRQGCDLEILAFADDEKEKEKVEVEGAAQWLRMRRELCGDPDEILDLIFLRPTQLSTWSSGLSAQKQLRRRRQVHARDYVLAATNTSSVRVLDARSLDSRLFAAHTDTVLSLALHPSNALLATTCKVCSLAAGIHFKF